MKFFVKNTIQTFYFIIISIAIGLLFMLIAYKFNFKNVEKNLLITLTNNNYEYTFEKPDYDSINYIGRTEFIMLTEVLVSNNNHTYKDALKNSYINYDKYFDYILINYIEKKPLQLEQYARYWHGYILPLKVLLNFFSLTDIKLINYFIQNLLILAICLLMYKNKLKKYIIPMISSFFLMMPLFTFKYLSQTIDFNLMLIFSLIILLFNKKIKFNHYKYLFLFYGIITNYINLLFYPLVTLVYPLIFYFLLNKFKLKEQIKILIKLSLFYVIGYASMFIGKWGISSLVLHKNIFKDAINSILIRTSSEFSFIDTVKVNLKFFMNTYSIFIISINILLILYNVFKNKNFKKNILNSIIYFVLFTTPFIWFFIVRNHSHVHPFFAYRILSISFISIIIALYKIINVDLK